MILRLILSALKFTSLFLMADKKRRSLLFSKVVMKQSLVVVYELFKLNVTPKVDDQYVK